MLIRVDSCRTRVDSCRTRVDSCQTRVYSCWLVLIRVDSCWLVLILVYHNRLDLKSRTRLFIYLSSIVSFFQITPSGSALYSWKLICSITWIIFFGTPFFRVTKINRVTIYTIKCVKRLTLKDLATIYFHCKEWNKNFSIPRKNKSTMVNTSFCHPSRNYTMKFSQNINKMTERFLKSVWVIYFKKFNSFMTEVPII